MKECIAESDWDCQFEEQRDYDPYYNEGFQDYLYSRDISLSEINTTDNESLRVNKCPCCGYIFAPQFCFSMFTYDNEILGCEECVLA